MTPELQSKVAIWRAKCADNTITKEELKEALRELAAGRVAAAQASAASKKKTAKAEIRPANEMLDELGGL